jgi:hypothetical protein
MGLKSLFGRILNPGRTPVVPPGPSRPTEREREMAGAWLEAFERGDLNRPDDIHDVSGWNTYWTNQLKVGLFEQGFNDMMSSDDGLIELLTMRGARTVLCAGSGLSAEPLALALHGFRVTSVDISTVAVETVAHSLQHPEHKVQHVRGLRITGQTFEFSDSGPIAAELCPPVHRSATHSPVGGGSLTLVAGDFTDAAVCPGPFDVVIERRAVQLFPEDQQEPAIERLIARLGEPGLFVSHLHDGCGGPHGHRPHHAENCVRSHGFVEDYKCDQEAKRSAPRLARLVLSTG